jgi:hypothetical protein
MKKSLLLTAFVVALVGFIVSCQKEQPTTTSTAQSEDQIGLAQNDLSQYFSIDQPTGITGEVDERDGPLGACCNAIFVNFYTNLGNTFASFTMAVPTNGKLNVKVERMSDGAVWNSGLSGILPATTCAHPSSTSMSLSQVVNSYFNNCEDDYRVTYMLYKPNAFGTYSLCSSATSTWRHLTTGVICF